jgi:hypothetical protein
MSRNDYLASLTLTGSRMATFETLIMAALRKSDSSQRQSLAAAFPDIAREFTYRYWCSGGIMPGEPGYVKELDDNLPHATARFTPPSPPPGDFECCASGRCEVCTPGYVWGRAR